MKIMLCQRKLIFLWDLAFFWEIIVPIIIEITKQVGCKYVYLFAADKTEEQSEFKMKKLISHYKNNFKFSECDEGMKFVKPEYDNHCYGLIQSVSNLESIEKQFGMNSQMYSDH